MTKHIQFYFSIALLALIILACKNASSDKSADGQDSAPLASYPGPRTDSVAGFQGCERAGFKALSPQLNEFKYQNYTFQMNKKEGEGETVEITIDSSGTKFKLPEVEANYFRGVSRDHFFVDIGTDPEIRDVIVYSLNKEVLTLVYRTAYLVKYPPTVANGSLLMYVPVEESEVSKMPACKDKDAWLKDGKRIGYGQRYMYHMQNRGLTRKSEFVCAPLSK